MIASSNTANTSMQTTTSGDPPGLHGRLTVRPAGPHDRAALTEQLARLLVRAQSDAPTELAMPLGPDDFESASRGM